MTKVYQFFLKTKLASDKEMVFKNSSTQIVTLLLGLHLSALLTTLQCTDKIPFLLQLYLRMITDIIKPFIFCFPSISFDCIVIFIFFFAPSYYSKLFRFMINLFSFFQFQTLIYCIRLQKFKTKYLSFSLHFQINYIYSCEVSVFGFLQRRKFEENNREQKTSKNLSTIELFMCRVRRRLHIYNENTLILIK